MRRESPYSDPYLCGIALGLVLLAAFVLMGRGLGATGAIGSAAAGVVSLAAPQAAEQSPLLSRYLTGGRSPWLDWLVIELLGVSIGGAVSAWLAGRLRLAVERGRRAGLGTRLAAAFGGGSVMGFGAILARGCTSGQALTGGALLSVGSWLFMIGAFAGGYALAPLLRRIWL